MIMATKTKLSTNINHPRDINYAEEFSGVNRKTLRRWWEKDKFPKPTLVEGKLYWLDSALNDWKSKIFGVTA